MRVYQVTREAVLEARRAGRAVNVEAMETAALEALLWLRGVRATAWLRTSIQ